MNEGPDVPLASEGLSAHHRGGETESGKGRDESCVLSSHSIVIPHQGILFFPRELCNICAHPSHFLRRPQDSFASALGVLDFSRPPGGTLAAPALAVLCQTTLYEPPGRVLVGALPISCRQKFTPARGGSGRAGQGRTGQAGRKALKAGTGAQGGQPPAILAILAQSWGRRGPTTSEPSRREGSRPSPLASAGRFWLKKADLASLHSCQRPIHAPE